MPNFRIIRGPDEGLGDLGGFDDIQNDLFNDDNDDLELPANQDLTELNTPEDALKFEAFTNTPSPELDDNLDLDLDLGDSSSDSDEDSLDLDLDFGDDSGDDDFNLDALLDDSESK